MNQVGPPCSNQEWAKKQPIINEIGCYEDMPAWAAYDRVQKLYFAEHKIGNSILGPPRASPS